ncbi:MAG: polyprenyl synthetase family protein, partial [Oscillospiraceae bacterium]|nr:polyprenyl synthetase family protein [Oscillospiraceae bacterium]
IADAAISGMVTEGQAVKAVKILSKKSGAKGMVGGQYIDLSGEKKSLTSGELLLMDKLKTGALISAACELGVVAGGGGDKEISAAGNYGENIGISFQIMDDILDIIAKKEDFGKPIGSDVENKKTTYVSVYGLAKAKGLAEEYTEKAIAYLDIFGEKTQNIKIYSYDLTNRRK